MVILVSTNERNKMKNTDEQIEQQKMIEKGTSWIMILVDNGLALFPKEYMDEMSNEEKLKIVRAREIIGLSQTIMMQGDDGSLIAAKERYALFQAKCAETLSCLQKDDTNV